MSGDSKRLRDLANGGRSPLSPQRQNGHAIAPLREAQTFDETPVWDDPHPRPVIDSAAYHGLAGEIVKAIEPHTEADPVALLGTLLVLFGAAIGPETFHPVGGARHPARLFACFVGPTGIGRKGQSLQEIRALFSLVNNNWLENATIRGLGSGEGLIARVSQRGDGPVEQNVVIVEPEYARLLAAAGRDGSTISSIVRSAWDGDTLQIVTKKDSMTAEGAHVSIISHITAEELTTTLRDLAVMNGFANRFLYFDVFRSKLLPEGGTQLMHIVEPLAERLRDRLTAARNRQGAIFKTDAARELWASIYGAHPSETGLLGSLCARYEAQILRLAVCYALFDGASDIDVEHIRAAKAVWDYSAASAEHIFGTRFGNEDADRLLDELRAVYPDGLDFTQQSNLFGRHASVAKLTETRKKLETSGLARTDTEKTTGRSRRVMYAVTLSERRERSELGERRVAGDTLISHTALNSHTQHTHANGSPVAFGQSVADLDASIEEDLRHKNVADR